MRCAGVLAAACLLIGASTTHADRIKLRGGGEIKGVVIKDAAKPDVICIQTETSGKLITFPKNGVLAVIKEASRLDDYLEKRSAIEQTAQAHYDFGLWCEEQKLRGPAEAEFEVAITLDPEFGPAHKKLGHVQHGSRWLTYDQQREAQGLVKYKGKWISKAEKDKVDNAASLSAEQSSWATRLKLLRSKLNDPDAVTRETAEAQIAAIKDPAAIPGLMRIFGGDGDSVRIRLAQLIAAIPGSEATDALGTLMIYEANDDVRRAMVGELINRHDPETTTKLIAVLKNKDPNVVGRAAMALAEMKHTAAVPQLVDALIQSDKKMMMVAVPVENGGNIGGSFSQQQQISGGPAFVGGAGAAVGGRSTASTTTSTSGGVVSNGGGVGGGAATQGFGTFYSQPYLTGPYVAPGVVAYGATSVPYGSGATASIGGNGGQQMVEMPAKVQVKTPNLAVLKALQTLTGVNFGFDQPAWKKWLSTEFKEQDKAPRRVPKP